MTDLGLLHRYLRAQRDHVLEMVGGLDDEQLRRRVLPSGWSILGLLHHLAIDDERFWFRCVLAGEQDAIDSLGENGAWRVPNGMTAADVVALYRDEIAQADAIIEAATADQAPAWWPGDAFGDWRLERAEQLMLHVIAEVACHAGHLDAARELIDGRQFVVVDVDRTED